jgi:hypothetical protein
LACIAAKGNGRPGARVRRASGKGDTMDWNLAEASKWAATAFTVLGAGTTAADLGRRATGFGFALLAVGSGCWLIAAQLEQEGQLGLTNIVLLGLNTFGVWRWLVRKAPGGGGEARAAAAPAE